MKENIQDKLRNIIREHLNLLISRTKTEEFPSLLDGYIGITTDQILSLIETERKNAVKGFGDYCKWDWDGVNMRPIIEDYLSQQSTEGSK